MWECRAGGQGVRHPFIYLHIHSCISHSLIHSFILKLIQYTFGEHLIRYQILCQLLRT